MPVLTKPCEGKLSEETELLLRTSRTRAGWGVYTCEICGQTVGVEALNGKWAPERHWPSVVYPPRKPSVNPHAGKRYRE